MTQKIVILNQQGLPMITNIILLNSIAKKLVIIYKHSLFRKRQRRLYSEQRKKQVKAWAETMKKLLVDKVSVPMSVFDVTTDCTICAEPAIFRCTDCGLLL